MTCLLAACATSDTSDKEAETPLPTIAAAPYPVPMTAGNETQQMFGDLHTALASSPNIDMRYLPDDSVQLRFAGDNVFAFNSTEVRPEQIAALRVLTDTLQHYPQSRIDIVGYTDNVGNVDYNRMLSAKRAAAVAQVLIEQGVPQAAISTRGAGKDDPVADNSTAAGRSRNRRVEIFISHRPLSDVADKSH